MFALFDLITEEIGIFAALCLTVAAALNIVSVAAALSALITAMSIRPGKKTKNPAPALQKPVELNEIRTASDDICIGAVAVKTERTVPELLDPPIERAYEWTGREIEELTPLFEVRAERKKKADEQSLRKLARALISESRE